ncbi:Tn3 family transposase [Candidatus Entotheonella palauensis]|uniref:Tn3 family transposase n=1 Tax=Candidatus Entotheonella palauensis TaxID=93172 RepID=UPI0004B56316|nr:Tn3 family transposase [Candidatus Entotheonella palauensis]
MAQFTKGFLAPIPDFDKRMEKTNAPRLKPSHQSHDEEIMNKASCLSLVSHAILYWNAIKINDIVENLRSQGEDIGKEPLSHMSLLPFRHVVLNGMSFIEDI